MRNAEECLIDQQKEKLDKIYEIALAETEKIGDNEHRFRALKRILQVIDERKYL